MYNGTDRVKQVNWLNQEVETILLNDQSGECTDAQELVEFWAQNADKPEWFDNWDYNYLIEQVADALS